MLQHTDGHYYCSHVEAGYCDRRSGLCFCFDGYDGEACDQCRSTHFMEPGTHTCQPKVLCPNGCSGAGTCDFATGTCRCEDFRLGADCSQQLCHQFDPLCTICDTQHCRECADGYFVTPLDTCVPCSVYDPRCSACDAQQCLECADLLLSSIRRSGRRRTDPPLPKDEVQRQLSTTLPFGTQMPAAFNEADLYYLKTDISALEAMGMQYSAPGWHVNNSGVIASPRTPEFIDTDPYNAVSAQPPLAFDQALYDAWLSQFHEKRGWYANGSRPASQSAWAHAPEAAIQGQGIVPLREEAWACGQGQHMDSRLSCAPTEVSHVVCGSPGSLGWASPLYVVREDQPYLRVAVQRTGGGLGKISFKYEVRHESTDAADMTATPQYSGTQSLVLEEGVVQLSFLIAINDDLRVEGNETFVLQLADLAGGAALSPQYVASVSIVDDDWDRVAPSATLVQPGPGSEHPSGNARPALATTAGVAALALLRARAADGSRPPQPAAAYQPPGSRLVFPGEYTRDARWLAEVMPPPAYGLSAQSYVASVPASAEAATPAWSAAQDSQALPRLQAMRTPQVHKGLVVHGPALLRAAAQAGTSWGGVVAPFRLHAQVNETWSSLTQQLGDDTTFLLLSQPTASGQWEQHVHHAKPGGLLGEYFANPRLNGRPDITRVDYGTNFTWDAGAVCARAGDYVSVRWTGAVAVTNMTELEGWMAQQAGYPACNVTLQPGIGPNDQVRVFVDHERVLDTWIDSQAGMAQPPAGTLSMQPGRLHRIVMEWRHFAGAGAQAALRWSYSCPTESAALHVVPPAQLYSLRAAKGSPLTLQVQPASAAGMAHVGAPHRGSYVQGAGLAGGTAGQVLRYQVYARDQYGNAVPGQQHAVQAVATLATPWWDMVAVERHVQPVMAALWPTATTLRSPAAQPAPVDALVEYSAACECFQAELALLAAGDWRVNITLHSSATGVQEVLGSGALPFVQPAEPWAPASWLALGNVMDVEAGQPITMAIRVLDFAGNDVWLDPAGMRALASSWHIVAASMDGNTFVPGRADPLHASVLAVQLLPTRATNYTVHLEHASGVLRGTPVHNSRVRPSAACGATSEVLGFAQQYAAVATLNYSITVLARDRFSNARLPSLGVTDHQQTHVQLHMASALFAQPGRWLGNHTYSASIMPMLAGLHELNVTLDGELAGASPYLVRVQPGPSAAQSSVVRAGDAGAVGGVAGQQLTGWVQVKDGAGNNQTWGGGYGTHDLVTCTVAGQAGRALQLNATPACAAQQVTPGVWKYTYTPTIAGEYQLAVMLNGSLLNGAAVDGVQVTPAALAAHTSRLGGGIARLSLLRQAATAEDELDLTIQAHDAWGNPILHAEDMPNVFVHADLAQSPESQSAPAQPAAMLQHLGSGKFQAKWRLRTAGAYIVAARAALLNTAWAQYWAQPEFVHPVAALAMPLASSGSWNFTHAAPLQALRNTSQWSARWLWYARPRTPGQFRIRLQARAAVRLHIGQGVQPSVAAQLACMGRPLPNDPRYTFLHAWQSAVQHPAAVDAWPAAALRLNESWQPGTHVSMTARAVSSATSVPLDMDPSLLYPVVLEVSTAGPQPAPHWSLSWCAVHPSGDCLPAHLDTLAPLLLAPHIGNASAPSPRQVDIVPGLPAAQFSAATGAGTAHAIVGSPAQLVVQVRDAYENTLRKARGSMVLAVLVPSCTLPGAAQACDLATAQLVHAQAVGTQGGAVYMQYVAPATGMWRLLVAIACPWEPTDDLHLYLARCTGHLIPRPLTVNVTNAGLDPAQAAVEGSAIRDSTAGIPTALQVTLFDSEGMLFVQQPPPAIVATARLVELPSGARPDSGMLSVGRAAAQALVGEWTSSGVVRFNHTPYTAGLWQLDVLANNHSVGGSPWRVTVRAEQASAAHSILPGSVPWAHQADYLDRAVHSLASPTNHTIHIQLRDPYNNTALLDSGVAILARMWGPGWAGQVRPVLPNSNHEPQDVMGQSPASWTGTHMFTAELRGPGRYKFETWLVASSAAAPGGLRAAVWADASGTGAQLAELVLPSVAWTGSSVAARALLGASLPDQRTEAPLQMPAARGGSWPGVALSQLTIQWSGYIVAPATAEYELRVSAPGEVRVWVESVEWLSGGSPDHGSSAALYSSQRHRLQRGQVYELLVVWRSAAAAAPTLDSAWRWAGSPGIAADWQPLSDSRVYPDAARIGESPYVVFAS